MTPYRTRRRAVRWNKGEPWYDRGQPSVRHIRMSVVLICKSPAQVSRALATAEYFQGRINAILHTPDLKRLASSYTRLIISQYVSEQVYYHWTRLLNRAPLLNPRFRQQHELIIMEILIWVLINIIRCVHPPNSENIDHVHLTACTIVYEFMDTSF
ncbi:hypothetical protein OBBRIDRAFT_354462 [Obba rivulosa]|uniref:Uncharacterized protein n=1 Tax=Obba rivulosa TaxID=1052685 RepID=A0A8E2J2B3_9APHY|nr:hypothetical protein OBBRIDRAFT_354462 [Obba rivulosa]